MGFKIKSKRGTQALTKGLILRGCPRSKLSQVTVFVIIAILFVAAIALFFLFRNGGIIDTIPASINPMYVSFLSCLEENTLVGIDILESQAGYIEVPNFEPGSQYMPFSNQLDFLGNPVPYWYYVSGNNIQTEQIPSKEEMEDQLAGFIEGEVRNCVFEEYYEMGFEIDFGEPKIKVNIQNNGVEIDAEMAIDITYGEDSVIIRDHNVVVSSDLGMLYDSAKKVYEKEQEELFLERYAVDTLRLYAPVDGVEITCSPMVWSAEEVFDELEEAIEENTLALKSEGDSDDYFVVDTGVAMGVEVRFINSKFWAHGFEVNPSEEEVLMSKPIGNQPGLGILGFCYVPYHFVYDVRYPVLIQVQSGDEIFQFPVAVVLQGNNPRAPLDARASLVGIPDFCEYKNTFSTVQVYDSNLRPVEAEIFYECSSTRCDIGTSYGGELESLFPQCINGTVLAKAEGFRDSKYTYSSVDEGRVEIIMDRVYEVDLNLELDGVAFEEQAIVNFISDDGSTTVVYPEQRSVELSAGQYEIQVQIYSDSAIRLDATTREQCIDVPKSGVGGLFGLTESKCFEIEVPAQIISSALAGGGKESYYLLGSELESSESMTIGVKSLPEPKSLEQLQANFILFEGRELEVMFL